MADEKSDRLKRLADELQNYQALSGFLTPSPGELPDLEGIDVAGLSMPLNDIIGGDHILYIDFSKRYDLERRIAQAEARKLPEVVRKLQRLKQLAGILVADVSGHRMTDSLVAAMLHQAFLLGVLYELDMFGEVTTRIFEQINMRFFRTGAVNRYFTMIYGEISTKGRFRFISAGHQPPAVFSREFGRFMKISEDRLVSFPPVGMFPSERDTDERIHRSVYGYKKRYEVNEINLLAEGDILLLHTDGLAEHAGGGYFPERAERLLDEAGNEAASEICERLRNDILEASPPGDDISVVVIRKTA